MLTSITIVHIQSLFLNLYKIIIKIEHFSNSIRFCSKILMEQSCLKLNLKDHQTFNRKKKLTHI